MFSTSKIILCLGLGGQNPLCTILGKAEATLHSNAVCAVHGGGESSCGDEELQQKDVELQEMRQQADRDGFSLCGCGCFLDGGRCALKGG